MTTHRHAPKGPIKRKAVEGDPMRDPDLIRGPGWRGCTSAAKTRPGYCCDGQPIRGGHVCRMHGGGAPQVKAKADERWSARFMPMAETALERLVKDNNFPSAQLGAVKLIVEQDKGRAVETANVTVKDMASLSREELVARFHSILNP
jgi:hypothetical protein